jgi:hypothetical protein
VPENPAAAAAAARLEPPAANVGDADAELPSGGLSEAAAAAAAPLEPPAGLSEAAAAAAAPLEPPAAAADADSDCLPIVYPPTSAATADTGAVSIPAVLLTYSTASYRRLARSVPRPGELTVEIGSAYGDATALMAAAVGFRFESHVRNS